MTGLERMASSLVFIIGHRWSITHLLGRAMDVDASTRASLLATESDDSPSQSTVDVNQEQVCFAITTLSQKCTSGDLELF